MNSEVEFCIYWFAVGLVAWIAFIGWRGMILYWAPERNNSLSDFFSAFNTFSKNLDWCGMYWISERNNPLGWFYWDDDTNCGRKFWYRVLGIVFALKYSDRLLSCGGMGYIEWVISFQPSIHSIKTLTPVDPVAWHNPIGRRFLRDMQEEGWPASPIFHLMLTAPIELKLWFLIKIW